MSKLSDQQAVLVWGNDELAVLEKGRCYAELMCPASQGDMAMEMLDGDVATVDEAESVIGRAIDALLTVGMFCPEKTVWIKKATFLDESVIGRSERIKKKLEILAAEAGRIAPGVHLLVTSPKVSKRSKFYKAFKNLGHVEDYLLPEQGHRQEAGARAFAESVCKECGLKMAPGALDYLLLKVGADHRQLRQEVIKLDLYLGKERRNVAVADVDLIVSSTRESGGWGLAEELTKGATASALSLLKDLLYQGQSMMGLIILLENQFAQLAVLRSCMDKGWVQLSQGGYKSSLKWNLPGGAEAELVKLGKMNPKAMHPYRASLLGATAMRYKARELAWCREMIIRAHQQMMTSLPEDVVMEALIVKLARAGRKVKR